MTPTCNSKTGAAARRGFVLALAIGFAVAGLGGAPARAQIPTIDSSSIQQLSQISSYANNQLSQLTNISGIEQKLQSATGLQGAAQLLNGNASFQSFSNGGPGATVLQDDAPNLCTAIPCSGSGSDFSSLAASRTFIGQTFWNGGSTTVSMDQQLDYKTLRDMALRSAAQNGYALALVARDEVSQSQQADQQLQNLVSGATDLRTDVQANSAVLIAQHQEMERQTALIASLLEVEASQAIDQDRSVVAQGGGSAAPAVYNAADYTTTGQRVKYTGNQGNDANVVGSAGYVDATQSSTPTAAQSSGGGGSFLSSISRVPGLPALPAGTTNPSSGLLTLAGSAAPSMSSAFGGLSGYASSNNGVGMIFAGANLINGQTGGNMGGVLSSAQAALQNNDAASISNLIRMAGSAASAAGNPQAANSMSALSGAYSTGQVGSPTAAFQATAVIAQSQGSPQMAALLRNGATMGSINGAPNQTLYATTSVVASISSINGNAQLGSLSHAAMQALPTINLPPIAAYRP